METVTLTVDNFIELYTKANIADETSFSLLEQEWKKFYYTATSEKEVKKFFKKAEKEYKEKLDELKKQHDQELSILSQVCKSQKEKIDNYEKEFNKHWYKLF